jgi:c-di-GMP-binding flagellar brake protein YcgR
MEAPSDDRYRLTHSSQIGTVLRDLAWQKCVLSIRTGRGVEAVTTVLNVDPASRTFLLDWCANEAEAKALLESEDNVLSALLRGVPVNFRIGKPGTVDYQGGPAMSAPFPDKLYHFQRRRHFRARTLVTKGYTCEASFDGKQYLKLDISDLSLSGVGLRSKVVTNVDMPVGSQLAKVKLDFRELGRLEVGLQVVGHWMVGRDELAIHHFGCAFVTQDGRMENQLQKLVFALELAHRT